MTALRLPAPAKINLFLNILGRRPDGYHDLQTVFQILDYGDWLVFEPAHEIVVEPAIAGIDPQENLVYRAARRLAAAANVSLGARIRLEKHIPMGAGLGGGSSDAATTLVGLSRLWGLDMALDELAELGLGLGADVPVFVRGFSAFAEGIGERLT
ncbi:MAG: 4-(cytidine 5'-diphospho)-2-C-methyl-D-erythritol kinase, partial [Pseudomonadales bacterium]|nr:4-(cytidine 5'-diphospho)-2-C-methyl-D-erythritol kinase [Pseudomonadales bacterium]